MCLGVSDPHASRLQPCVLQVGVRPALAMVRTHRSRITSMFVFGLLCFFLSPSRR